MLAILFAVFSLAISALIAVTARNRYVAVGIVLWMTIVALLSAAGVLRRFELLPPPAPMLFLFGFLLTVAVGLSRFASGWLELTPTFLIGFQSFRIIVELLIHVAVEDGIAPPQMTWTGLNFDMLTGLSAAVLAPFASRLPRRLLLAWNTMGLALLIWVVLVATVSFPTRFQLLLPSNTWIADIPFVWLPTVHVTAALLFHIVLFRRLARPTVGSVGIEPPPVLHPPSTLKSRSLLAAGLVFLFVVIAIGIDYYLNLGVIPKWSGKFLQWVREDLFF